ncbi:hypothetical protein EYF80_028846 [Liparis tanakae]|uniref:Uncharacterized protein n=1 Tax=Liparis tanakae TaxID=230148 RepID=A0A4Z2H5I7_9TELE|nr:hypothetical protein EYF80_028846 [Liparis tanakae]
MAYGCRGDGEVTNSFVDSGNRSTTLKEDHSYTQRSANLTRQLAISRIGHAGWSSANNHGGGGHDISADKVQETSRLISKKLSHLQIVRDGRLRERLRRLLCLRRSYRGAAAEAPVGGGYGVRRVHLSER